MQDSQKFYCANFYSTSSTGESYIRLSQNLCILQTNYNSLLQGAASLDRLGTTDVEEENMVAFRTCNIRWR